MTPINKPGFFYFKFDSPFFERYRISMHVLFWLLYLIYEGLIWSMVDGKYAERVTSTAIELPVKISATYFTLYILIDRLLIKRHYAGFLLGLIISMFVFGTALRILAYYIIYPIFYTDGMAIPLFFPPKILIAIFSIYSIVGIVASFHLIKHWHKHQQAAQQLEKEKLESELSILKSQINPHFLFNTLNSLYVLTMNQSRSAPEIVHKLSELMSYMLYDSNQNEVLLQKELHYIENYIALEKLRYESRLDISLHVYSSVEGITIAPLIILPFVENCFKHGVSHQIDDSWIRIDISMQQTMLVVKIENSLNTDGIYAARKVSGIGLQNVRKRLELIYPHRYQLQLLNEDESFLVILKLELDKTRVLDTEEIAHTTALMHEMPDRR